MAAPPALMAMTNPPSRAPLELDELELLELEELEELEEPDELALELEALEDELEALEELDPDDVPSSPPHALINATAPHKSKTLFKA